MTNRYMKLLGATTALVAFASTSHAAAAITTSTTTALHTSTTTGGIMVQGAGSISVTAGPAITISSSTAGDNIISVSTGGIIRAGGTGAVVSSSNVGGDATVTNAAVVINNSGTIAAVGGNTKAIDLTTGTATNGATITNAGTISGSVTFGGTAGTDTFTTDSGTVNGDIAMSNGTNAVTISNSTVNGNITGGTGATTVTINNSSVVSSSMSFGNGGNNTVTVNGSTLKSNNGSIAALTFGNGNDLLTVSNSAVVSGSIDFGTGTNTMQAYGTYTTGGAISNLTNLNVSGTTNVNHTITGAVVGVGAASTLNFNNTNSIGALTTTGAGNTVRFTSGTVAGTTLSAAAGTNLGFTIVSNTGASTSNGKLTLSGGAANIATSSVTLTLGDTSGYIANGTSYTLITGNAGATAVTSVTNLTNSGNGVYRYDLSATGNNVDVVVRRVSTSSLIEGSSYKNLANALDVLGTNSSNTMVTVQSMIGQQASAAGVQSVIESLAPTTLDGVGAASVGFNTQTGNLVSNRLASLRSGSALKGIATGDAADANHMWVEGFGSHVEQDDHNGQRGYKSNGGGATFGLDTDMLVDGVTTGAAFSYAKGSVDSKAAGNASTDIDTYAGTLYGSHVLGDGTFVNAQAGLGYNKYKSSRTISGIGTAKGDFNGWQASAKGEVGKDFAVSGFTLTPLASLQGTYLDIDSYTETGAAGANLRVDPKSLSSLDFGAGAQAAYAMPLENGSVLKPTARAKYIYRAGDTSLQTTSQFTGGGSAFATNGVKADRGSVDLGAGLLLTTAGGLDFSLNYDADIRSSLTGHTGQVKARWAF